MSMLVIKRKVGEYVRIGGHIVVKVLGIDRGQVKLAIEAPRDVTIDRPEAPRTATANPTPQP